MRTYALTGLLTSAVLFAAAGCGGSEKATSEPGATVAPAPQTELMITLRKAPNAEPVNWTLTCEPAGGTHPDAEKACDQLAAVGADVWKPTPPDQACTEIYGGPEQAEVTGTWKGESVDATFARKNGCELDRWTKVSDLFGKLPKVR